MAAWRNWPPRYSGRSASSRTPATSSNSDDPVAVELHEVVHVGAPRPAPDELGARVPVRSASSAAVRPLGPASRSRLEQAELEARVTYHVR